MKKIHFTLSLLCAVGAMYAQSITTVSIDGTLAPASRRTTTPGEIQAVVAPDFDLSNVSIHYTLEEECELVGAMPSDFSTTNPQTVTVKNNATEATKDWAIYIKKVNPTGLPFAKTFANSEGNKTADWTPETVGWAFSGIDTGQKGTCRYGTQASFVVAFNAAPGTVSYKLNSVSNPLKEGDEFNVEASADGMSWRRLRSFAEAEALTTTAVECNDALQSDDRYVRWVYAKRSGINVNLNNILVSESAGIGAALEIAATGYGLKKFSVKNGLQLYAKTASSIRDALELHAVVAEDFDFDNPANNVLEVAANYTSDPETLPVRFAAPQTVSFTKDGTTNHWTIYVRPIRPAALPLSLSFSDENKAEWDSETKGWAPCGLNAAPTRLSAMSFDGNNAGVVFAMSDAPRNIKYDLCINAASVSLADDAVFEVQVSDESAAVWTTIKRYDAQNPIPAIDAQDISHQLELDPEVRYIKFIYVNRGSSGGKNLNLNNLLISNTSTAAWKPSLNHEPAYRLTSDGTILFLKETNRLEVFDLTGSLLAVYDRPGASVALPDGVKGLILFKALLNDGSVVTQKAIR